MKTESGQQGPESDLASSKHSALIAQHSVLSFFTLCALFFARSASAQAQQSAKVPRIGFLLASSPNPENPSTVSGFKETQVC